MGRVISHLVYNVEKYLFVRKCQLKKHALNACLNAWKTKTGRLTHHTRRMKGGESVREEKDTIGVEVTVPLNPAENLTVFLSMSWI